MPLWTPSRHLLVFVGGVAWLSLPSFVFHICAEESNIKIPVQKYTAVIIPCEGKAVCSKW